MSTLKQYSSSLKGAIALLVLVLVIWVWGQSARQAVASPFHQWRTSQVVAAFNSAGLELEIVHTGKKGEDDGLSMFMAVEATRFRIPSAGETEGGIILSFYKADDLAQMRNYYLALNKSLPQFSSWVFVKDNILLQINQSLPGPQARQYAAALEAMKPDKTLMVTARP